ncbi:TVP38/TMEM64 family protein [Desulfuromonas sp. KJ2020]|uniref:TVP38/TMEM64 family protein n=1 Tax=Desulfuromonas sp. KJ2020 TaxID=2919173 RepID=UPI0020A810ED|nr:TVP38/TMEM64 family protein [Desulfuromonas sp. KJ2020]MCP3176959.1 TVP38/TMEM64 family protein [Desulfuromonas sp. KJ2020]
MEKKKILLVLILAGLVALFIGLDLNRFLSLEGIKTHRDALEAFYARNRLITPIAFILVYIIQTALSLPGALLLSLAAGALFGVFQGTLFAVTGATLGATCAFLVSRYLLSGWAQKRVGSKWDTLNVALERDGLNYLLFLRFVPIFPFFLINLVAALTRLPLRTFFLGTFVGILPGAFVYVNAGASLASIESMAGIVSPRVLGSFVLLGGFSLVPILSHKWHWARKSEKQSEA